MNKQVIPEQIKHHIEKLVEEFNENVIKDPDRYYTARYRGRFLYLDRYDYGTIGQICRLTYTGDMEDWEFAIFRYSNERYDPDEWLFPGSEFVDGSIQGAMKAGLEAYP